LKDRQLSFDGRHPDDNKSGEGEHEYVRLDEGDVTLLRAGVAHAIVDHPKTPPEPHERVRLAFLVRGVS
jgi:hypothetical protein